MAKKPKPAAAGESTPDKQPATKLNAALAANVWKAGQSGNPAGRPKGARNKLGEAFLADLCADWEKHGPDAIEKVRKEKPDAYLKVVASILPKELNVRVSEFDEMTDEQLDQRIRQLARFLEIGVGEADVGKETAH